MSSPSILRAPGLAPGSTESASRMPAREDGVGWTRDESHLAIRIRGLAAFNRSRAPVIAPLAPGLAAIKSWLRQGLVAGSSRPNHNTAVSSPSFVAPDVA